MERSVAPGTKWESRTGEVQVVVADSTSVSVTFWIDGRLVTWRIDHFTDAFHPVP